MSLALGLALPLVLRISPWSLALALDPWPCFALDAWPLPVGHSALRFGFWPFALGPWPFALGLSPLAVCPLHLVLGHWLRPFHLGPGPLAFRPLAQGPLNLTYWPLCSPAFFSTAHGPCPMSHCFLSARLFICYPERLTHGILKIGAWCPELLLQWITKIFP